MERMDSVVEALHLWQLDSTVSRHLSLEEISHLAEDGALTSADKSQVEHLSRCPSCMEEWSAWRQATSTAEAPSTIAQNFGSYGFLQAASTEGDKPFRLLSQCGRFSIDVLPQEGTPSKAMMIFTVLDSAKTDFDGQTATVRDREQRIVLQGEIHNGQFARIVADWDRFDLRKWTVFSRK